MSRRNRKSRAVHNSDRSPQFDAERTIELPWADEPKARSLERISGPEKPHTVDPCNNTTAPNDP
eukprot:2626169-Alexandrium_andersonii.AAC.1